MLVENDAKFEWGPLANALSSYPACFMMPIYLGDAPFTKLSDITCFNATASLLKFGSRHLVVTCSHVLEAYRHPDERIQQPHFQIGHLSLNPGAQLIDEDPGLDLAVLEIRPDQIVDEDFPDNGLPRKRFFEPASWPTDPVTTEDVVSLAGYPGVWREHDGVNRFTMFMFSLGTSGVHAVGETYFYTRIEIEKCEGKTYYNKELVDLGGMSGGPVFRWRRGEVQPALVGFVTEYHSNYDLLYVRSSRVLRSDGMLSRER